jgi:hypothetical protein
MAKPIKVHLTQTIVTPVNEVVLGVILECDKVKFAENFMVCVLDGIEAIIENNFLDIYCVNVLRGDSKLKVVARLIDRSISLEVEYQASLTKVVIHLVSLQELQETSFLIDMCVDEANAKSKAKGAKFWPTCISNTIYNFLDVLTNDLPKHLLLSCNVDHKIDVVPKSTPPSKSPY